MTERPPLTCVSCGREFEQWGRGRKATRCPDCQAEQRTMTTERRTIRHAIATMTEWVEVLAPFVANLRRQVTVDQEGHCKLCEKRGRLRLAIADDGSFFGLCAEHYADWITERRSQ